MTADAPPAWGGVMQGDCLEIMSGLAAESVDLAYLDPPFNTGEEQRGRAGTYGDVFSDTAAYVDYILRRVKQVCQVLSPTGSILLHCDWRACHHLRLMLDGVFGADNFVNHLIWSYGLGGSSPRRFARKHDDILFYAKGSGYYFDPPRIPATSRRMAGQMKKATDVLAIPAINNMASERTGYPTQKPLALLQLLVEACCPPGGRVLDPFCGSGTTLVAAAMSQRDFLGIDANAEAVTIARKRLAAIAPAATEVHA